MAFSKYTEFFHSPNAPCSFGCLLSNQPRGHKTHPGVPLPVGCAGADSLVPSCRPTCASSWHSVRAIISSYVICEKSAAYLCSRRLFSQAGTSAAQGQWDKSSPLVMMLLNDTCYQQLGQLRRQQRGFLRAAFPMCHPTDAAGAQLSFTGP